MDAKLRNSFQVLCKSLTWYAIRSKAFKQEAYDNWQAKYGQDFAEIESHNNNSFTYKELPTIVDKIFNIIFTSKDTITENESKFLQHFGNLDIFDDCETLISYALDNINLNASTSASQSSQIQAPTQTQTQIVQASPSANKIDIELLSEDTTNIEDWFTNYERLSTAAGWNTKIKGEKLNIYLKDNSLKVWRTLEQNLQSNYDEIKKAILTMLNATDDDDAERKFFTKNQQEDESVTDFALNLRLCHQKAFGNKAIDPDMQSKLLKRFIDGANSEIKTSLLTATITDMTKALELAQKIEKNLKEKMKKIEINIAKQAPQPHQSRSNSRDQHSGSRYASQQRSSSRRFTQRQPFRGKSRGRFQTNNEKPKCFHCQKPGHIRKQCRKLICNNCSGIGHNESECWRSKNQ